MSNSGNQGVFSGNPVAPGRSSAELATDIAGYRAVTADGTDWEPTRFHKV